jgi:hypothetical protein
VRTAALGPKRLARADAPPQARPSSTPTTGDRSPSCRTRSTSTPPPAPATPRRTSASSSTRRPRRRPSGWKSGPSRTLCASSATTTSTSSRSTSRVRPLAGPPSRPGPTSPRAGSEYAFLEHAFDTLGCLPCDQLTVEWHHFPLDPRYGVSRLLLPPPRRAVTTRRRPGARRR